MLVMDNASYHHELNHKYFLKGKAPSNAPKGLCNGVLDKAGCRSIKVMRDGKELNFEITKAGVEPDKSNIPGTVHANANFPRGPSVEELRHAMNEYLPAHCRQTLDSRVEKLFREKQWGIIWTPPYFPKFQPINKACLGCGKAAGGWPVHTGAHDVSDTRAPAPGLVRGGLTRPATGWRSATPRGAGRRPWVRSALGSATSMW